MASLRKLQQLVKVSQVHHHCNYPQSIRRDMAISCVIPTFWKLSAVLPLADCKGQQAALASVLLPLLCGLPAAEGNRMFIISQPPSVAKTSDGNEIRQGSYSSLPTLFFLQDGGNVQGMRWKKRWPWQNKISICIFRWPNIAEVHRGTDSGILYSLSLNTPWKSNIRKATFVCNRDHCLRWNML